MKHACDHSPIQIKNKTKIKVVELNNGYAFKLITTRIRLMIEKQN